ncbi:hypothetical protein KEJ47_09570 [Candidatus Bathyarchaeota archaeon]|nr:hypothetical protein [Candidatus Bathyarchaeota archaeon]
MKRLILLTLIIALAIPYAPRVLANGDGANGDGEESRNETNVDIKISAGIVNLNVTSIVSESGTIHIFVNGTEVTKTTIIKKYGASYEGEIIYLQQRIGDTQLNLMAFANYTDRKLSMLFINDNLLAKWIGCLNSTQPIGQQIFRGNTSVVMELTRLNEVDEELVDMMQELGGSVDQLNSELEERRTMEEDLWARVDRLEAQYAQLRAATNGLQENASWLDQRRFTFITLGLTIAAICIIIPLSSRIVKKPNP